MGRAYIGISPKFPDAAREALGDMQLRTNLARATGTIRAKRAAVVGEKTDWEALRTTAHARKMRVLRDLPELLEQFERNATAAGAIVHWAPDAATATRIVTEIAKGKGVHSVVKVKSLATDEIGLNEALQAEGIEAKETDLAELIVQLAGDHPSHILVPAIHKNRDQIRDLFVAQLPEAAADLSNEPRDLAMTARAHLRERFLDARMAVSGANFAIADTGALVVVESEGNGRMCLTLPETLVTVVGIEKLLPSFDDLGVFMQVLPRSSTGERMNPYTTIWTGVTPGDGPQEVHIVLLDNGRVRTLADEVGREALACIRCSACMNVCPVYERTGGHAYGSVYPGPIGAILTPQLQGPPHAQTLPFASTLCGACYDVCPVKINIPEILVHLRAQVHEDHTSPVERLGFGGIAWVLSKGSRIRTLHRLNRLIAPASRIPNWFSLPVLRGWTNSRRSPAWAKQSFRQWWESR